MQNSRKFIKSTQKTIKKLCEEIRRYFGDFKIQTTVGFEIEKTSGL